jgi:glycerol uptake facilitator-like aquaporin
LGPYLVAQVVGAILGVLAVDLVFPDADIAATVTQPGDGVGWGAAFLAEIILGFVLMLVIKGTAVDDRAEARQPAWPSASPSWWATSR